MSLRLQQRIIYNRDRVLVTDNSLASLSEDLPHRPLSVTRLISVITVNGCEHESSCACVVSYGRKMPRRRPTTGAKLHGDNYLAVLSD